MVSINIHMANSSIKFRVSFIEPQAHYAEIEMQIEGFHREFVDIKLPVWTPGSYLIREYAKHIEQVVAKNEAAEFSVEKQAKNTWRVFNKQQDFSFCYRIYGFEVSVRTNFIDADHAFLSPAATFMYIDGHLDHAVSVAINLPEAWTQVSTGLTETAAQSLIFDAPNFDILYDSPFEIGNQDIWFFDAAGVKHQMAMVSGGNYNKEQLAKDITRIVEEETSIWGENPNTDYVIITHNYQSGSGGLEHLNSTVLGATRNGYNQESSYKNYLNLVAHEYFHLWNVKRLRPQALGPFNYELENYTTSLWIMEGFTAYYDNIIMRRCGFRDEREYLQLLAQEFNAVYNRAGYQIQPVAQSSFDAWIKHYRPDENSANTGISYYSKGAMLASAIDIKIIAHTKGAMRLDDLLRVAYTKFYKDENRGFLEPEFKALAESHTGVDLSEIFEAAYTTQELDYNEYFNLVGYEIKDQNEEQPSLSIGIKTANNDTRILVKGVDRGSGAWDAGLNVNDELIAVNGFRIDPAGKELENMFQQSVEGDIVEILVARDGLMKTVFVPIRKSSKKSLYIQALATATASQKALGKIWLSLTD